MEKQTIALLIIAGFLVLIIGGITLRVFLFEKEKNDWNDYAYDYCSSWEAYDMGNVFNLSEEEKRPFNIYLLIKNNVVEENWESSYLECCRIFDMDCMDVFVEEDNSSAVFISVGENTTHPYRMIDFHFYTEKELLWAFQNYGYNANGSFVRI